MTRTTTAPVLTQRALNRALLARQGLLQRWQTTAVDAVERLVGLQAQAPIPPYFALWNRIAGFQPSDLGNALLRPAGRALLPAARHDPSGDSA